MENTLTLELRCRACDAVMSGETEDELAVNVQEHVARHGHTRPITAEHIRSRLAHEAGGAKGDEQAQ